MQSVIPFGFHAVTVTISNLHFVECLSLFYHEETMNYFQFQLPVVQLSNFENGTSAVYTHSGILSTQSPLGNVVDIKLLHCSQHCT